MPAHDTIKLGCVNLDQTSATGATAAGAGLRLIKGAVRGAHQPVTGTVKKTVRLVIHLHRHMGAAVQVSMHLALVTNGKGTTRLAAIEHVKWNSVSAIDQIGRIAQGNYLCHGAAGTGQALTKSHWCSSPTECATYSGCRTVNASGACAP